MKQTDLTLLEQMHITDFEIQYRKDLFGFGPQDTELLKAALPLIEDGVDSVVERFYQMQTGIPEIALLIGDADTLARLRNAQRKYIVDLFVGRYDMEYVNNRLRIGLVHKRIGVEPKLYLAAVYTLKTLLQELLSRGISDEITRGVTLSALEKLFMLDTNLIFDTYIRSLLSEIEIAKNKSDRYASELEGKVRKRTLQLEEMMRTDPLTGLFNMRHLNEILTGCLRRAARRAEPVSVVYIDINEFKGINDNEGHLAGDEVLRLVGSTLKDVSRDEDSCFRYGGDEFCVILPNCRADQARDIYITRLSAELSGHRADLTLSVGVVQTGPKEFHEASELIGQADKRMYEEKRLFRAGKPVDQ